MTTMATTYKCPACSNPLTRINPLSSFIACSQCGAISNIDNKGSLKVTQRQSPQPTADKILQIGDEGTFNGISFKVFAQFRYTTQHQEWDVEDGEYCSEKWEFDEWYLISPDMQVICLYTDAEGAYVVKPVIPTDPALPGNGTHISIWKGRSVKRIDEYGAVKLESFWGDFPSNIDRNSYAFVSYTERGKAYTIEYEKMQNQVNRIQFYEATPIAVDKLKQNFGGKLNENSSFVSALKLERLRFAMKAFGVATLVMLLLLAISFLIGKEKVFIYHTGFALSNATNETERFVTPEFTLDNEGGIYDLTISSSFDPFNSSLDFVVDILDAETFTLVNTVACQFYTESGRDSDGNWTEQVTSDNQLFKLDKAGRYFARIYIEHDNTAQSGSVTMRIEESRVLKYYLISAVCFGVLTALIYNHLRTV